MLKLINLDEPVCGLDGLPLTSESGTAVTPRNIIANALMRGQAQGQEIRSVDLALTLFRDSITELGDADFALAKEAIEKSQTLNNLAKAAALRSLAGGEVTQED